MQRYYMLPFVLILSFIIPSGYSTTTPENMIHLLNQTYQNKGSNYQPRTRHFNQDGSPEFINELILESSPYLLQHAHNPINWSAWNDKTLKKARQENKLIFLSIGYATCHWCHVMEEESFEDKQVAKVLNKNFISIKVDREIRPDVDEVFMAAVQLINGRGGWPLNMILTPDGRAFFGGTYFPKEQLLSLLQQVQTFWHKEQKKVINQADAIQVRLEKQQKTSVQTQKLGKEISQQAIAGIMASFDELEGGFGQAPKFPHEGMLLFLLDEYKRQPNIEKLTAINTSLIAMAQGGFYDVIGGGFARYSTDNAWAFPHFEKMLYNQAQLALVYIKAYNLTHNQLYKRIAKQTLDYVLKEMQADNKGFYSATDADSEGEEGTFFIWTLAEIKQILGAEDFALAQGIFDFSEQTIFEEKHIIRYQYPLNPNTYKQADVLIKKLYQARQKRPKPLLDNKILLSWNAMMARAFLLAAQVFNSDHYHQVAKESFTFLQTFIQDKTLKRVLLDKQYSTDALLEDYAHLIALSLDMFDDGIENTSLQASVLMKQVIDKFWDKENFGFLSHQNKQLYLKTKNAEDGAILNSNALLLGSLVRLSQRVSNQERDKYLQYAQQLLDGFSQDIAKYSQYYASMIRALNNWHQGSLSKTRWLHQGKTRIKLVQKNHYYQFQIHLAPGYHINSNQPKQKDLIPTKITNLSPSQWQIKNINYPQAKEEKLAFFAQTIAVYSGDIVIDFELKPLKNKSNPSISLTLQACNEQVCLPPEVLVF